MDNAQWSQGIVEKPLEEIATSICSKNAEKKARPQRDKALNCPRCNSTNTKFCYFNNYSLTQPRYFCKTCRRYWTEGGSLRNIPVGGGSRKNKRSSAPFSPSKKSSLGNPPDSNKTPSIEDKQDLNHLRSFSDLIQLPTLQSSNRSQSHCSPLTDAAASSTQLSAMELLIGIPSRGLNGFAPPVQDPNAGFGSGFSLPEFKPSLTFSLELLGSGYDALQDAARGRSLFPFEDVKQHESNSEDNNELNKDNAAYSGGYWTGMLDRGSW